MICLMGRDNFFSQVHLCSTSIASDQLLTMSMCLSSAEQDRQLPQLTNPHVLLQIRNLQKVTKLSSSPRSREQSTVALAVCRYVCPTMHTHVQPSLGACTWKTLAGKLVHSLRSDTAR